MKRKHVFFVFSAMAALAASIVWTCCSLSPSSPLGGNFGTNAFNAVFQTGPRIPDGNNMKMKAPGWNGAISPLGYTGGTNWDYDSPVYKMFKCIEDFSPTIYEAGIMSNTGSGYGPLNIYGIVWDITSKIDGIISLHSNEITDMNGPKTISLPWDFGNNRQYRFKLNYFDSGGSLSNWIALNTNGTIQYCAYVLAANWTGKKGYDIAELVYDTASGNIDLDVIFILVPNAGGVSLTRAKLTGNMTSHDFALKGLTEGSLGDVSLTAKGISQGSNNSMLFRMTSTNFTGPDNYFALPSEANENVLKAIDPAGTNLASLTNAAAPYTNDVAGMTMFASNDVPYSAQDFHKGTANQGKPDIIW